MLRIPTGATSWNWRHRTPARPILDQGDGNNATIYTYTKATESHLGNPIATTVLTGSGAVGFAFTPGSRFVFTADAALDSAALYDYPAGGSPVKTVMLPDGSLPVGVAIVPSEQFTLR